MVCILQLECNFLHGYFRCCLLIETVDIEVKITSMQGNHTFRRDRTSQLIKHTLWSTRLHPHPTIIKKMKTFLELERELGPNPQSQNNQFRPPKPDTNPLIRKETKATEKRKRLAPTKKFKVKVVVRPNTNKVTMQPPQGNTRAPMNTESQRTLTPTPENNPPHLEDTPAHASTPWPEARRMFGNLF